MSSVYTPTKADISHAAAREVREGLAVAVHDGLAAEPDVTAAAAALTTSLTGADNDLVFTAKAVGVGGNKISVTYVDPEAETATESVSVAGPSIVVTLRSVSTVLSTAAQVAAAIEADTAANALVSVANAAANNGTGVVTAMAKSFLTGGVDGQTAEEIVSEAAGLPVGEVVRLTSASEIDLEDAMRIALALSAAGYAAFNAAVTGVLNGYDPA